MSIREAFAFSFAVPFAVSFVVSFAVPFSGTFALRFSAFGEERVVRARLVLTILSGRGRGKV